MVGDGKGRTLIRSKRSNNGTHHGIKESGALVIYGDNCIFKFITFENICKDDQGQAVALFCEGDLNVFYQCEFKGYQDTLFVNGKKQNNKNIIGRQFFRECDISGTIDFIFGNAQMILQKCQIRCRQLDRSKYNVITASGREEESNNTGIVIQCCDISADYKMDSPNGYLGRAWKTHARVVVMKSTIADIIAPAGWTIMSKIIDYSMTAEFTEFANSGLGASTTGRIKWPKYKSTTNPADVLPFTVETFINGKEWLPATGVPFDLGFNC